MPDHLQAPWHYGLRRAHHRDRADDPHDRAIHRPANAAAAEPEPGAKGRDEGCPMLPCLPPEDDRGEHVLRLRLCRDAGPVVFDFLKYIQIAFFYDIVYIQL